MAPGAPTAGRSREHPHLAVLLLLAGGALVLAVGGLLVFNVISRGAIGALTPSGWTAVLGLGGIADGSALIVVGLLLRWDPARYPLWGTLGIFLALLSLVVAAGGLLVGFGLALIGAILTLAWTPSWELRRGRGTPVAGRQRP